MTACPLPSRLRVLSLPELTPAWLAARCLELRAPSRLETTAPAAALPGTAVRTAPGDGMLHGRGGPGTAAPAAWNGSPYEIWGWHVTRTEYYANSIYARYYIYTVSWSGMASGHIQCWNGVGHNFLRNQYFVPIKTSYSRDVSSVYFNKKN